MRKIQKQELIELIDTLKEASEQLKRCDGQQREAFCGEIQEFVEGIYEYALGVLCQEAKLVTLLEKIYETLFQVAKGEATPVQFSKEVQQVEIEACNLKVDQIEVAFFCYKASMADSLESVYLAAKADPQCEAFFVPIPYFDRDAEDVFGEMHLEGQGCYSDKFELTDWQQYDVQQRHPDIIFIMNPYDETNHVTSVHPYFYSSRLKEHTDCLVYIEYGIPYSVYRDPEAIPLTEYRERGYVFPAHLHSDYVIDYCQGLVGSHKQTLRAFDSLTKQFQISEKDIEQRFVALGSPKLDKVLNTGRKDYELPKEWEERIGEKKVVLLNSSLGEFLKASETGDAYFKKLQSIIDEFSGRDEVVLWWRPHPLFETTIRTMRSSLHRKYMSIVQNYIDANKGIYDCTEDMNRAIAWSDAMISDESSLLVLYAASGKPFYIPAITKVLENPVYDGEEDFRNPLKSRIEFMKTHKGANIGEWNCCIWWEAFVEENRGWNIHYHNFLKRFLDFVVHPENYPETEEYRQLQIQMIRDFAVNSDGTAGQKIYEFAKQKIVE